MIPIGDEVRLQVFKSGFQTHGEDFTNDALTRDLAVQVKPPSGQYSIYQKAPVDGNSGQSVTPQPTEGTAKPGPKPH